MILAEIFVYVRSHAHVRFAIPQNPLGGPFSAMHASVMHLCTHVTSHACPHASSCPGMQWCSMKLPHMRCRRSCRNWLYTSNVLEVYFMTCSGSVAACAGVLLHIHVLMLNHQCWRECACVRVRTWSCVSVCVCVCMQLVSFSPSLPPSLEIVMCSPIYVQCNISSHDPTHPHVPKTDAVPPHHLRHRPPSHA